MLVATDVAARGIDIDDVTHVINYQCPGTTRRTCTASAARAGPTRTGIAVTLVDWDELHRWELINSALGIGVPEPVETYSTSENPSRRPEHPGIGDGRIAPPPRTESTRAPPAPERPASTRHPPVAGGPAAAGRPTGNESTESAALKPPILRVPRNPRYDTTENTEQTPATAAEGRPEGTAQAPPQAGGSGRKPARTRPAVRPPPPSRWPCLPPNDLPPLLWAPWRVVGPESHRNGGPGSIC